MPIEISLLLTPRQGSDPGLYLPIIAKRLKVSQEQMALVRIVRRSIDARGRQVKLNIGFEIYLDGDELPQGVHFDYPNVAGKTPVIVVGAGPAGLMAALRLIELGFQPIVLERGKDVSSRKRDIAQINRNGPINPDSNYAFGEGGAGSFSDGKLFTRSKKRGDYRKVLEVLHLHGAREEILYDAHPHIGTDHLPRIIVNMRNTILRCGGEVLFSARVSDLFIQKERIKGVYVGDQLIEAAAVILATGHSARDIYSLLYQHGIELEAKPFAVGLRVEHPQVLIDTLQYHMPERGEFLPAAAYSLVTQVAGRGVYSFCMCPGGFVVPGMTQSGEMVLNGMSPSNRNNRFANAGVVTEVRLSDYAHLVPQWGVLAGMHFQQELERKAYMQVQDRQIAPAQRLVDFVQGNPSSSLSQTSYAPGVKSSSMHEWLPSFMGDALRRGLLSYDSKMRGYLSGEAMVLGVETRTSSPVRIPRDPHSLMHPQIKALFPCAEGAGYAGGIVSAAMDGERCADAVARLLS